MLAASTTTYPYGLCYGPTLEITFELAVLEHMLINFKTVCGGVDLYTRPTLGGSGGSCRATLKSASPQPGRPIIYLLYIYKHRERTSRFEHIIKVCKRAWSHCQGRESFRLSSPVPRSHARLRWAASGAAPQVCGGAQCRCVASSHVASSSPLLPATPRGPGYASRLGGYAFRSVSLTDEQTHACGVKKPALLPSLPLHGMLVL